MVWCGVVWCGVVWCGVAWHGIVWYDTSATVVISSVFSSLIINIFKNIFLLKFKKESLDKR